MELAIILLVHLGLLVSEAYYDTIVHKAKSITDISKKKKYTQWYHFFQLIIYLIIFLYGYYIGINYKIISWLIFSIILNYITLRVWLFNSIYNYINDLAGTYLSSSELFDVMLQKFINYIIKKFSVKPIGLLIMIINIIKSILFFLSIIYLSKNLI